MAGTNLVLENLGFVFQSCVCSSRMDLQFYP